MSDTKYTGQQLEDLVFSALREELNGIDVYKGGTRPIDSSKKDIVVMFHEGSVGKYQEGSVLVNAYVPNIVGTDGLYYKDIVSCKDAECLLLDLDSLLTKKLGILFENKDMLYATEDNNNNQHIISLKLRFKHIYY